MTSDGKHLLKPLWMSYTIYADRWRSPLHFFIVGYYREVIMGTEKCIDNLR